MPCRHFATYTLSQLTLREGNMIAKVERVEGRYLVDLTDYANKVHIRKERPIRSNIARLSLFY